MYSKDMWDSMSLYHPSFDMLTLMFGDLVYNKMGLPLIFQPMKVFGTCWSWTMVTTLNNLINMGEKLT